MNDVTEAAAPLGPLHGVRVVDASRVLAGPYCGSLLAEMGADVVRMEHPGGADEVRAWAPKVDGMSAAFAAVNHSKRSIAVDLAKPAGVEVFRRLLCGADVLVENFRAGTLERLGLDRAALQALAPRLIHCGIRAFPAGTSTEKLPGYEASLQAYTGVMSVTGEHDGDPVRCGVSVIDLGTGLASVIAILAALRERDRTGRGQYVEPALMRTATNFLNYQIAGYSLAGAQPQRFGSGHEVLVPYRNFDCADGPLLIAAGNDRLWARLCDLFGLRDAQGGHPYPALAQRVAARDEVNALVARAVAALPRQALWERLQAAGIPSAPVNTVAQYVSDPSLLPAGVLCRVPLAGGKELEMAGPLFAGEGYTVPRRAPPAVGEHTQTVLTELGFDAGEIAALCRDGAVSASG